MSNKHKLLAEIQHSNLKEGQFVIRIGGEWYIGDLTQIDYSIRAHERTKVKFEGYLKAEE